MIILPPQAEFCDCVYDFILNLINKKPEQSYTELCENTQQERCQLSECDVVKKFRFPSKEPTSKQEAIPSIDASISDNPITFNSHPDRFPTYIPRHPPVYHGSNSNDESSGSSYAETQVIIIQPVQPLPAAAAALSRSDPALRKRTRKGKKKSRKHFPQNNPLFSYNGPHW